VVVDPSTKRCAVIDSVLATTLAVAWLGLADDGVRTVGDIPRGLPPLTVPPFDASLWLDLLPAAVLIGLVGFVESVAVAQTLAVKNGNASTPTRNSWGWVRPTSRPLSPAATR
jgi:sulfate permease, SulP family